MESHARILVAYATRYGATEGIARAIAAGLKQEGLEAEARPVGEIFDLAGYTAFVLGSPVYAGNWLAEAVNFVRRNRDVMGTTPVAYFTVGMLLRTKPQEGLQEHRAALEKVRRAAPEVEPIDAGMFVGSLDKGRMGLFPRLLMKLMRAPEGDFRDWDAVGEWSRALAARLKDSR